VRDRGAPYFDSLLAILCTYTLASNCPITTKIGANITDIFLEASGIRLSEASTGPFSVGTPHYEDDSVERPEEGELAEQRE